MDRILSVSEAVVETGNDELYDYWDGAIEPVLKFQDAKTSKWWIEKIESIAGRNDYTGDDTEMEGQYELWISGLKWQQLKAEVLK